MKRILTICDRCDARDDSNVGLGRLPLEWRRFVVMKDVDTGGDPAYDICPRCVESFQKWADAHKYPQKI